MSMYNGMDEGSEIVMVYVVDRGLVGWKVQYVA